MIKKKASYVDLGKFFFALCVVGIHTSFQKSCVFIHSYIFAIAVPFFFVCSGFFLGKKIGSLTSLEEYRETIKKYWKRLIIPYFFWSVWYFFVETFANSISEGMSLQTAIKDRIVCWILSSPGGGLWYIQVILLLILLLLVTNNRGYHLALLIMSFIFSIVPSCVQTDIIWIDHHIIKAHNVFWDGLYFLAGVCIGEFGYEQITMRWGGVWLMLGVLLKVSFSLLELKSFSRLVNLTIAGGLFCLFSCANAVYGVNMSLRLRRWSTIIYFTHISIKYVVQFVFMMFHIKESDLIFFFTLVILMPVTLLIDYWQQKNGLLKRMFFG